MAPSFVAIDFETANHSHASISSCGVARVTNGQLQPARHWYCHPAEPYNFTTRRHMNLTGITPAHLADARGFDWLGPHLLRNIGDSTIVAHNAHADLSMLKQTWHANQLGTLPTIRYVCTLNVAKHLYPHLPGHTLDQLSHHILGETLEDHHRADVDATTCARLLLAMLHQSDTTLDHWTHIRPPAPPQPLRPPRIGNTPIRLWKTPPAPLT